MSAVAHLELVFSRPQTTQSVTRGAARLMIDMGYAPLLEVCLPNGRRADVMAIGRKGDIVICEVKSGIDDYRVDRKWHEYGPFCDVFFFAVTEPVLREDESFDRRQRGLLEYNREARPPLPYTSMTSKA